MRATWLRNPLYLFVAGLAVVQAGCLAVAAGAAGGAAVGYVYCQGKVCQTYAASLQDTEAATRSALADLGMPVEEEEFDATGGFFRSKTSDGDAVRIHLDVQESKFPADGPLTRVCVRVATFGDHPVSARMLDQIGVHLTPGALPPPGTWSGVGPPPPVAGAVARPNAEPPRIAPPPPPAGALPPTTAPPPLLPPESVPQPGR